MYQFFPYIIFSAFSFAMLIFLAIYGIQYWNNVGVKEFIFAMLASAWWVFCQAFELMAVTLPVKIFWADIEYLGMVSALAYLMLAVKYAGYGRLLTKRNIISLLLVYCVFWALFFTDQYHGLMRINFSLDTSAIPYTIKKDYGMVYPLYVLFVYMLSIATFAFLFITIRRRDSLYRKQAKLLFIFLIIILIPNLSYYLKLIPIKRFDLTPAFFGFGALLMSWSIYQHKFLNIMPIARDLLIETMDSGVLVTDKEDMIIDINRSAHIMLDLQQKNIIGRNISEIQIFSDILSLIGKERQDIFPFYKYGEKYIYEMKTHPLNDKEGEKAGCLIILNDVTEQRENVQKLINQQKTLSVIQERERMGRELHDGLGQVFGYINAQAQTVKEYITQNKNAEGLKHLEELIGVSRNAHGDIREYILEIRGITPRNRSFSAVLKQYAFVFSDKHQIPVSVTFNDDLPEGFPSDDQAVILLKIIQEALNNIRKYAGPCQAEIGFVRDDDTVIVNITDSGVGFDPDIPTVGSHYGLSIMRERAGEMGAELQIVSQKDAGTRVIIKITEEV